MEIPLSHVDTLQKTRQQPDEQAQQVADLASRTGTFLSNHPDSQAARALATGMVSARANQEIQDWLGKFGTARVSISADKHFSLKDSSLEMLYPLYDSQDNLFFTQDALHRTDERSQADFGWRHFAGHDWMAGVNAFVDHDFSRSHTRFGAGAEYGRDYLKLSANAYLRASGWRNAPDAEDYEERPANGWDLRAEGYLPAYPQLGAKLMYEQYYGNEVALLGRDNRQKNPHAVTEGVNYTPFPLMTISAEHRQGTGGRNDSRVGLDFSYRIGEPLRRQLDTDAVGGQRTLAGSRYDLVERNNNIVLEYHKKEVIRLALPEHIEGRGEQTLPLDLTLTKATHGLNRIQWEAPALLDAGGKITGSGTNWQVTLPAFRPEQSNRYAVAAVAWDNRGNASKRVQTDVTVTGAGIDAGKSPLTLDGQVTPQVMMAGNEQTHTLTLSLRDAEGQPVTGLAGLITTAVAFTPADSVTARAQTTPVVGTFTEMKNGEYEAPVTAGTQAGNGKITVRVEGGSKSLGFEVRTTLLDLTHSTFDAAPSAGSVVADGLQTHTLIFTARDAAGTPVTGDTSLRFVPDESSGVTVSALQEKDGVYSATVTSTRSGEITVRAFSNQFPLKDKVVTPLFVAGPADKAHCEMTASASRVVVGETVRLFLTMKDMFGNPVTTLPDALVPAGTAAVSTNVSAWTPAGDGKWAAILTAGATPGELSLMPQAGGSDLLNTPVPVTVTPGAVSAVRSTLTADRQSLTVKESTMLTLTAKDARDNPVTGLQPEIPVFGGTADDGNATVTVWTDNGNGTYTATLTTGEKAGELSVMPRVNGQDAADRPLILTLNGDASQADVRQYDILADGRPADGAAAAEVRLTVRDDYGNPVPGKNVDVTPASGMTVLNPAGLLTDANGQVTAQLASTLPGDRQVTAKVGGRTGQTFTVRYAIDATKTDLTLSATTASGDLMQLPADGSAKVTLSGKLTVQNHPDVPLAGQEILVEMTPKAGTADSLSVQSAQTQADGSYTVDLSNPAKELGEWDVKTVFRQGGKEKASAPVSVGFVAVTGNAQLHGDVTATPQLLTVDETSHIAVTVDDGNGHVLKNQTVTFTVQNQDGTPADAAVVLTAENGGKTGEDGVAKATLTTTVATPADNPLVVTATLTGGHGTPREGSVQVVFSADVKHATAALTADNTGANKVADGQDAYTLTAVVTDEHGNPAGSMPVTFNLPAEVTPATGEMGNLKSTGPDGKATLKVVSTKAGTYRVTATPGTSTASAPVELTFVANKATAKIVDIRVPDPVLAGKAPQRVTVMVADAHDNPVEGLPVTLSATPAGLGIDNTPINTVADGGAAFSVTSVTAQSYDLTATVTPTGGSPVTQTKRVVFTADESKAVLETSGDVSNRVAGTDTTVSLTLKAGDVLLNGTATVAVTAQPAGAVENTDWTLSAKSVTFTGGRAQVTFNGKKAGTYTLTITPTTAAGQTPAAKNVNVSVVVDKAQAQPSTLEIDDSPARADGGATIPVKVKAHVTDQYGNPVEGAEVSFTLKDAQGRPVTAAVRPVLSRDRQTTDADGVAGITITSTVAGNYILQGEVNGKSTVGESGTPWSGPVAFVADRNTATILDGNLTITPVSIVAGRQGTVRGTVTDKYGNPLGRVTVMLSVTGGPDDGVVLAADNPVSGDEDDNRGNITTTLTGLKPGSYTLHASIEGLREVRSVDFTVDSAVVKPNSAITLENADGGYITGNEMKVKVSLHNAKDEAVTGETDAVKNGVTVPGASLKAGTGWTDNGDGSYSAVYVADATVTDRKASLQLAGWSGAQETATAYSVADAPVLIGLQPQGTVAYDSKQTGPGSTGHPFAPGAGFPTIGFRDARFLLVLSHSELRTQYDWQSSAGWARVSDAPARFGDPAAPAVTFGAGGNGDTVTITGTPKKGGQPITYSFKLDKWFSTPAGTSLMIWDAAVGVCSSPLQQPKKIRSH